MFSNAAPCKGETNIGRKYDDLQNWLHMKTLYSTTNKTKVFMSNAQIIGGQPLSFCLNTSEIIVKLILINLISK